MKNNHQQLFQTKPSTNWRNLLTAAIVTIFIITIGLIIINSQNLEINLCGHLAYDYCAYWSVGRLVNQHGWKAVYNLELLSQYQKQIYPQQTNSSQSFEVCPVPYLPPFVIPFQLLSMIQVPYSFLTWTLVNVIGFIIYLHFFSTKLADRPLPLRLDLLILISSPVVLNLLLGQINIWLAICVGEFIRAILSDKPYKAGLWLGGWLLKPQLLILIILFLVIWRSLKVLAGFLISAIVIMGITLNLIGANGFLSLMRILFEYSEGSPTNYIAGMMNWRMLGWHITSITSSTLGWITIILGSLLTISLTLFVFRRKIPYDSSEFTIALLGIFAATGAVTWHAHLHLSIILIPPMIYLLLKNRFDKKLFLIWVFFPILFQITGYTVTALIRLGELPPSSFQIIQFSEGFPGFVLNLLILGWSIVQYNRGKNQQPKEMLSVSNHKLT